MPASFSRVFLFGVVKLEHAGRPCNPINKNNHWHRLITRTKIASHGLSTMGGGGGTDRERLCGVAVVPALLSHPGSDGSSLFMVGIGRESAFIYLFLFPLNGEEFLRLVVRIWLKYLLHFNASPNTYSPPSHPDHAGAWTGRSLSLSIYIYIHIYMHRYREKIVEWRSAVESSTRGDRERETEREGGGNGANPGGCVCCKTHFSRSSDVKCPARRTGFAQRVREERPRRPCRPESPTLWRTVAHSATAPSMHPAPIAIKYSPSPPPPIPVRATLPPQADLDSAWPFL